MDKMASPGTFILHLCKNKWIFHVYLIIILCKFVLVDNSTPDAQDNQVVNQNQAIRMTQYGYKHDSEEDGIIDHVDSEHLHRGKQYVYGNIAIRRIDIGKNNLAWYNKRNHLHDHPGGSDVSDGIFLPGDLASPFSLPTLSGILNYPGPVINESTPLLIHAFNPKSAFLQALWNGSASSCWSVVKTAPLNTHFIFMSQSENAQRDALWMRNCFQKAVDFQGSLKRNSLWKYMNDTLDRLHFVILPTYELGEWLPTVFKQWTCEDHNCGLDQIRITQDLGDITPHVIGRLDAQYDWLPSPGVTFGNKSLGVVASADGCSKNPAVSGKLALLSTGGCSYFQKVSTMQASGAAGVLVLAEAETGVENMECNEDECDTPLNIPASMLMYDSWLEDLFVHGSLGNMNVSFQNTPCDNFFIAVDEAGKLAEVGWLLTPSLFYLVQQAKWFSYKSALATELQEPALVIPILNNTVMHGSPGAVATVTLPPMDELKQYSRMQLDMSLSCPGSRDTSCAHWDHTINLYVCCDKESPICNMELGRWISPFRRRIGRWLTDVTDLLPLLTGTTCTFTMATVSWAMPWIPSLSLRFEEKLQPKEEGSWPYKILPLYVNGSVNFNHKYNSQFPPMKFTVPEESNMVQILAVITGHGSDENGCGEFCVSSHHFSINGHLFNYTFSDAGTPYGCVKPEEGAIPNEHGTWLYGRGGWCDGQEVDPWGIDITPYVTRSGQVNTLTYFGYYNGTDPNPKQGGAVMIMYSYLVFFKPL